MILRSQDREAIIKVSQLYITKNKIKGYWLLQSEDYYLGKYSSKENAMKALDIITKELCEKGEHIVIDIPEEKHIIKEEKVSE